jgi:hypothetical protein
MAAFPNARQDQSVLRPAVLSDDDIINPYGEAGVFC